MWCPPELTSSRCFSLDLAGTPVVLREWGDRDARPLVYWHGLSFWGPWELLEAGPKWSRQSGFRVLAVSAPGWETPALPPPAYRPTALARLVVAVLDALGLERVVFAGFSWGASIGAHLGADFAARLASLVLLDAGFFDVQVPPGRPEPTLAETTERYREQNHRFRTWEAWASHVRPRFRTWRPSVADAVRIAMWETDGWARPRVAPEVLAVGYHGVVSEPPSRRLPQLERAGLPILLLVSTATLATSHAGQALGRFRATVPSADVAVIDSSHYLLVDALDETVGAVTRWIRSPPSA
jgi:pimeloyl-ACP methyl ester carboxylesterase